MVPISTFISKSAGESVIVLKLLLFPLKCFVIISTIVMPSSNIKTTIITLVSVCVCVCVCVFVCLPVVVCVCLKGVYEPLVCECARDKPS